MFVHSVLYVYVRVHVRMCRRMCVCRGVRGQGSGCFQGGISAFSPSPVSQVRSMAWNSPISWAKASQRTAKAKLKSRTPGCWASSAPWAATGCARAGSGSRAIFTGHRLLCLLRTAGPGAAKLLRTGFWRQEVEGN